MAERGRESSTVERAADRHNSSRRNELNERLKNWGMMALGGTAATWAAGGIALIGGPVALGIGIGVWLAGYALAGIGVIGGTINLLSRIRKKNR